MGDRFYKDIEVPDLPEGVELAPPEAGFIQVFGRGGKLATVNSAGEEVIHDGGGGGVQTRLDVNGGNSATTDQEYVLRLDFGSVGGSSINPDNLP